MKTDSKNASAGFARPAIPQNPLIDSITANTLTNCRAALAALQDLNLAPGDTDEHASHGVWLIQQCISEALTYEIERDRADRRAAGPRLSGIYRPEPGEGGHDG
ncbi:hypothetical protein ABWL39_14045 [Chitinivorax sp. PXF-14]|uniref:hypothetical protein n=1 Tax=Chitinivorax sp. PXF-14 TaxID=3230488 RepID=UPI0034650780